MDSADLYKALLGLVTGALGRYFGLYWKIREELVAKYDQELRAERVTQHALLWRATEPLAPRCARALLRRAAGALRHGGSLSATVMQVNRGAFTDE